MKNTESKDYIAYEYLSLDVSSNLEPLYIDTYEAFGWILINNATSLDREDYYINHYNITTKRIINLKFKRDRRIKNKARLLILQKKIDLTLKELEKLENTPASLGGISAISTSIIGIIFISLAIFIINKTNTFNLLSILYMIIGIIGLILPYFIYKIIKEKKEKDNISITEELYNTIYDNCEQAKKIIN